MVNSINDAHTGRFIGSDVVSDGVMRNVISGVDVTFDPLVGMVPRFNTETKQMVFNPGDARIEYLHIMNNATEV